MRRILVRVLVGIAIGLLLLILIGAGAGYWLITRPLPQTSGTLQLSGLSAPVTVIRDGDGVPHIYGETEDDLYMAQGFVHAQDRLWQMEFNRHIGHGQLAELFGKDVLDQDKFLRTIGLGRAAQRDWENSDADTRWHLEKYAQGVNAFIHSHQENLPIEFVLLGDKPADWQPVDTLVWGKVMAYDLGGNYDRELLRAALQQELGDAAMRTLIPKYPTRGPFIIPPNVKSYATSSRSTRETFSHEEIVATNLGAPNFAKINSINTFLGAMSEGLGSNNWVLDGTKTTTGKPLLANDPHLGIQMPSIWYLNALRCNSISDACRFNVVGYSFPGVPGIIIGHNDRIAWGMTNLNPDIQDLYIEKINPANPNQYEYMGKWQDMQIVNEVIHVKRGQDVNLPVKITRHGPIMSDVFEGVHAPLALQWTATRDKSALFHAVRQINIAQNWDEFRAALRDWNVPAQNFVYADVDGNIGYQMPGSIPIRAKGDGTLPVPSWTGEYEWTGYIPFDELPMAFNPSDHFVISANNQVVPNEYKYLLTQDWEAPYRAERIEELLRAKDKLSLADLQAIQGDLYSAPLVKLQKYIEPLPTDDFLTRRALDYVRAWDGRMDKDAQAAAILEATYHALVNDLFANRMSANTFEMYQADTNAPRQLIDQLLDDPQNEWWDDPATPARETREDRLKQAYKDGVNFLGTLYGDAPPEWRWGRIHYATFEHPFGSQKPLDLLFNFGPVPTGGNGFTVWNAGYHPNPKNYAQRTVSSMRQLADLSNWDQSLWINATGQSGQPLDAHYSDLIYKWRDMGYETLPFTRAAVQAKQAQVLTLTP